MDKRDVYVLKEALKDKHRDETFERALGRAIRNEKGGFERYIRVISEVRNFAYKKKIDILEAARILAKV